MKTLRDIEIEARDLGLMAYAIADSAPIFEDLPWREAAGRYNDEFSFRGLSSVARCHVGMGINQKVAQPWRSSADRETRKRIEAEAIKGLASEFVRQLFYGNPLVNPREFMGLSSFYSTIDKSQAMSAAHVIDASSMDAVRGPGKLHSIWLVGWGEGRVDIAYPRGSEAGLSRDDLGVLLSGIADAGEQSDALTAIFGMRAALVVKDWRCVVRIANLDESSDFLAQMAHAMTFRPREFVGKPAAFYMGQSAWERFGEDSFRDIPVRCIPQLRNDEERVA